MAKLCGLCCIQSVVLQNEVPYYCQYYLQQCRVKSVNLSLELVPFSKTSTEWHTQLLVIIVDRLQLAIQCTVSQMFQILHY